MPAPPAPATWEAYAVALGDNLRRRRLEVGLTQEDLAHRASMTRTHYQQIERGTWKQNHPANPSIKVLVQLAQQLQTPVGDLLPPGDNVEWTD